MVRLRTWRPSAYGVALITAIVLYPFVVFAEANRSQITQPARVVAYAVVTLGVALLVLTLVQRRSALESRERVAVATAAIVACFLNFSVLFDSDPSTRSRLIGILLVWLLITAIVARLAFLVGGNATFRLGLLIFMVTLLVLPVAALVTGSGSTESEVEVAGPGAIDVPAERPNVYWLMLDGYARPDVLEAMVGLDDDGFVTDLEDRGFQVSGTSRSSYPRTHLSLASTLQMDYALEPGHDVEDDFAAFTPVVAGRNETTARFEAMGYETAYGPAAGVEWSVCHPESVDVCLPPRRPTLSTGELEDALLDLTPLGLVGLPVAYADPLSLVEGIEASEIAEPFFAFQHVLAPHEPYRYDADCNARAVPVHRRSLSGQEQHEEYANQIRCVNDLVVRAVDQIVARDPSAVIVVQSDHGSDFSVTWDDPEEWTGGQLYERLSAFNAMRLPPDCPVDIEGEPLVNTFRIVFACIEGREPDLLDYRAFIQPIDDVSQLTEIDPERIAG